MQFSFQPVSAEGRVCSFTLLIVCPLPVIESGAVLVSWHRRIM